MHEQDRIYIIVFSDSRILLFPRYQKKELFKDASCYSCPVSTTIDDVRSFVYSTLCDMEHGNYRGIFKAEWSYLD